MEQRKIYKPGQIITIRHPFFGNPVRYRITKSDAATDYKCTFCDMFIVPDFRNCKLYCERDHNDWKRNPNGYFLKRIDYGNYQNS